MCNALKSERISLDLGLKLVLGFEAMTVYTFRHMIYSKRVRDVFDLNDGYISQLNAIFGCH